MEGCAAQVDGENATGVIIDGPARSPGNRFRRLGAMKRPARPDHTCSGFSRAASMPNTLIARATSLAFMVPSFASAAMAAWAMW